MKAATALCRNLKAGDAAAMLRSPDVDRLKSDEAGTMLVRRVIGALLFDPTLPYAATPYVA